MWWVVRSGVPCLPLIRNVAMAWLRSCLHGLEQSVVTDVRIHWMHETQDHLAHVFRLDDAARRYPAISRTEGLNALDGIQASMRCKDKHEDKTSND